MQPRFVFFSLSPSCPLAAEWLWGFPNPIPHIVRSVHAQIACSGMLTTSGAGTYPPLNVSNQTSVFRPEVPTVVWLETIPQLLYYKAQRKLDLSALILIHWTRGVPMAEGSSVLHRAPAVRLCISRIIPTPSNTPYQASEFNGKEQLRLATYL